MEYRYKDFYPLSIYPTDEQWADNPNWQSNWHYSVRVGPTIRSQAVSYQIGLFSYSPSEYEDEPYWSLLVHPNIKKAIAAFDPLMDLDSIIRLNHAVLPYAPNNYAISNDSKFLPYKIYYARKSWTEAEWSTDRPDYDLLRGSGGYPLDGFQDVVFPVTYISNVANKSGPYRPQYLDAANVVWTSLTITVQVGGKIILKNQANVSENGLYFVGSGAWTKLTHVQYPTLVFLNNYSEYLYARTGGRSWRTQLSVSTFSDGTINALQGFYLYPTLNDALNQTNQITFAYKHSVESAKDKSLPENQYYIDENHIQHESRGATFVFSPIDYNYPKYKLLKGVGCCPTPPDIVTTDIPDNMSFSFMGHGVFLSRSGLYHPLVATVAELNYQNANFYYYAYQMFPLVHVNSHRIYDVAPPDDFYFRKIDTFKAAVPRHFMFSGEGINVKTPTNYLKKENYPSGHHYYIRKDSEGTQSLLGERLYLFASDLNTIMVVETTTQISIPSSAVPSPVNSSSPATITGSDIAFLNGLSFQNNASALAIAVVYKNTTPNSSNRIVTFQHSAEAPNRTLPAGYPYSFSVDRGGEFTLPPQLKLNMPACYFHNYYRDVVFPPSGDTVFTPVEEVKGKIRAVQDPISVGDISVVLTLDRNFQTYYSEVMILNGIKGRLQVNTEIFNPNTGDWVNDHTIGRVSPYTAFGVLEGLTGDEPTILKVFGDFGKWYRSGVVFEHDPNAGFAMYGDYVPVVINYTNAPPIRFAWKEMIPKWFVASDAIGGYPTGLPQGTVWMDSRVSINAYLEPNLYPNTIWTAVRFSEWQDLMTPEAIPTLERNTGGPPNVNTLVTASDEYGNPTAFQAVVTPPTKLAQTDFYKRTDYYLESLHEDCYLTSLQVQD